MSNAIETAKFLRRYQSWRKGEIDVFYPDSHAGPNPVEISAAIDRAIAALEAQPPCGADGAVRDVAALASAVRDIPDRIKALGGQRFAYVKLSEVIDTIYAHASQPAAPVAPAAVAVPDEWREILAELADDVKCNVAAEYPPETRHYPSQKRRFDEAMEIVLRAEAMLAASQGEGVKS